MLNTHLLVAYMLEQFGSDEMRQRYLPDMVMGERRAAICLTEPGAGSDLQSIETTAVRNGDDYVINGGKLFITNGPGTAKFLPCCARPIEPPSLHIGASASSW